MASDYYALLGIPYNATPDEIRAAYFQLARSLHPDVNAEPAAKEKFMAVQQAYETLANPQKRAAYDISIPAELRAGPAISANARFSQSALACADEGQLMYVLIDLICTGDLNRNALPPAHLCLVLDRSTSMQGQRMDMIKSSSLNLLQQLRSQDVLSVVTFSDRAEVLVPPTRASALSKSDHRISLLQTGGGTEILQGLKLGMAQLHQSDNTHQRHLVLMTDGHTYGDDEACVQLARDAADEGISISVVGIGTEWNDQLMDQIAVLSGGNSIFVSTPHDLDNFLAQKMSELESVYARGLRFEFETAPDVHMRYAFRLSPSISELETQSPILLGDLHHRKSVSFLLELMVPPLFTEMDELPLLTGKIWMEIPGRTSTHNRVFLNLTRPVKQEVEPEAPPTVIVEAMSKLTLYRLQEKVRLEVGEGQIDKATKHMHYLATHLLSQGDRELAHTVLIEAEHIQQSRRFSGEGEKRIKYGTRALLLPPGSELKT